MTKNLKNVLLNYNRILLNKYVFHPRVPNLVFDHSVWTDLVEVGGKFEVRDLYFFGFWSCHSDNFGRGRG